MKKILFSVFALMLMSISALADNVCKITTEDIEPGMTGTITFSLDNAKNIDAFNFNLVLPEGLTYEDYDTTDRTWISKKDNWTISVDDKGTYFLVIGYSIGTPMQPADEDKSFMTVKVKVAETFTGGTITLNTFKFAGDGSADPTTIEGGQTAATVVVADGENNVGKFVEDGQVVIVKNGKKYTATGVEK